MKISTILDHIDSGHMALPEFQRGYVWNSDQVRKLFTSLYLRQLAGPTAAVPVAVAVGGGITSEEEEAQLEALNDWMEAHGLPRGVLAYDFADSATGEQKAVFDLAWPSGIQEELSQPVVVLLNEETETIAIASQSGFRCFTVVTEFQRYVQTEVLAEEALA